MIQSIPLLSPQNNSRLHASQQFNRKDGRDQGDGYTAGEHIRKNAKARYDGRMEVDPSDPGRDPDTDEKAKNCPDNAQGRGFGREESIDQTFRSAQRFHNSEVAAAVEDPSDERGQHAEGGSEHDQ